MLPGNSMMGISYAMSLAPAIPEIIDSVKQKENVNEDDIVTIAKISDVASGLNGCFTAFGSFSGPIIGGLLSEKVGF